jgi:Gpi18-like mannosyltransferase
MGKQVVAGAALLTVAFGVHSILFANYVPNDLVIWVSGWYERIADLGFSAFSRPFSNYTPPYLYLLWIASLVAGAASPIPIIKAVAVAGAVWLTFCLFRLFRALGSPNAVLAAIGALLLPSVILNTSLLGQADTFWVAACVLGMTAAIEKRFAQVAFWSGVAFAFKAQAIFFAPFVMYLFLTQRAPWWCWSIPAFVYAAAMLPAWLAGWDWWYLVNVYFRQAAWRPDDRIFISNGGSWWTILGYYMPQVALRLFPLGYLLAAVGTLAYVRMPVVRSPTGLLLMATLSAAGLPFLLPGMHERFFMLADVLAYCLAIVVRTRSAIVAAVLIQIGSALPVATWAYDIRKAEIVAPFFILGGLLILCEMIKEMNGRKAEFKDRLVASATA